MTSTHDCSDPDNCVQAGYPQYDGFRVTEIWVVTAVDPVDDQEGLVSDPTSPEPLMASDRRRLEGYVMPRVEVLRQALPDLVITVKHLVLDGCCPSCDGHACD